jgi:polyhydroxyalkanoate synthesis regulator phasin
MKENTTMMDQLKKVLLTGVGLAVKTWTEVEAAGKEAIRKAELSDSEAKRVLKNLRESYEKTQENMEGRVTQLVKDVLKKADIATRSDVKDLWDEIRSLKKELKAAKAPKRAARPGASKTAKPRARKAVS